MKAFDHYTPTSLPEALDLLSRLNGQTYINAGGTDLMLKMKAGFIAPQAIINIKQLPELKGIAHSEAQSKTCVERSRSIQNRKPVLSLVLSEAEVAAEVSKIELGALTTLRELTRSPIIRQYYPCLSHAASQMASEQIRSFATLGGNLCNASPSADLAPPLIVLGAAANIAGPQGERQLSLEDFFLGPGQSALQAGELLRSVELPAPKGRAIYIKHSPRAYMDIAVVGVGASLEMEGAICRNAKIVLAAVAPTPLRAKQAEAELTGHRLTDSRIARAAKLAAEASSPIDDVRGSAWYRRQMVEVITCRALEALSKT